MRRVLSLAALSVLCAATLPSRGAEPVASLGKQRAARAATEWEVRDVSHPVLGPIRYAVPRAAVTTAAGNEKILSVAYVSCEKGSGKIAIELTNASASDPAGGLRPMEMPRLVCHGPGPRGDGALVKSDLAATWEIGTLGDTLARGLAPSALRRCAWIDVLQNVAPPPGWPRRNQRISMEILPYGSGPDSVFAACGEATAYGPEAQPPAAVEPAPGAVPARTADAPWKPARTVAKGRSNVRAAARVESSLVVQLAPGTEVLVQQASEQWWKVKPRRGAGFSGYLRQDRIAFE